MNAVSGISRLLMVALLGLACGCGSSSGNCDEDLPCNAVTCKTVFCDFGGGLGPGTCRYTDQTGTMCVDGRGASGTCQSGACVTGTGGTGGAGGTGGTCGEGCGSPSDFSGTWTGTYECTPDPTCGEPSGGPITLEVTQNGCSATYTDGEATFAGSVCGDVFEFEGGGDGYTESGTLMLVAPNMAMKESRYDNTVGDCGGDCADDLSR